MADTVQYLLDRAQITDCIHQYATAIDTKDWDLLSQCFEQDLEADFRSFAGKSTVKGRDTWVEAIRQTISGFDATQHTISNITVEIEGDTAIATAYIRAHHFLAEAESDRFYTIGGYYTLRLRRAGEVWRIGYYKLTVTWQQGNRQLLRAATRRVA